MRERDKMRDDREKNDRRQKKRKKKEIREKKEKKMEWERIKGSWVLYDEKRK